jgi:hypothetical protein
MVIAALANLDISTMAVALAFAPQFAGAAWGPQGHSRRHYRPSGAGARLPRGIDGSVICTPAQVPRLKEPK